MILAAISGIFAITFQILSFGCIRTYGIATYEYAVAQFVTFCWAGMMLFAETFVMEGGRNGSESNNDRSDNGSKE